MGIPNGVVKIQNPQSKNYKFVAIPKPVEKHLEIDHGDNLAWLGVSLGSEDDYEDIAVAFVLDKTKSPQAQTQRILKLLQE